MKFLGEIVRLQVQTTSLKVDGLHFRRYEPAGIVPAPGLTLDAGGVWGLLAHGERLADVHHRDHPESKNRGENPVSIGFTGHYDVMRRQFGEHLVDGIAGENILVSAGGQFDEQEFSGGLAIELAGGERVMLSEIIVATPCVEFGRFALQFPDDNRPDLTVTDAVRFLNDGVRGFYATYSGATVKIGLGDRVYIA